MEIRGEQALKPLRFCIIVFFVLYMPTAILAKPSLDDKLVLMWQVPKTVTDTEVGLLVKHGVNLVQSFRLRKWSDDEIKSYLNRFQGYDIGVIMTIGWFAKINNKPSLDYDGMAAFIQRWKDHPSVFAWHPFDEPSNKRVPASYQEEVYKLIKNVDPDHPVFVSWNGTSPRHYDCCFSEQAFDILDLHAYVKFAPTRRQEKLNREFTRHKKRSYPIIITIRAFNGPKRPDLLPNGLELQYTFFFKTNHITKNIGFYGWQLAPNRGISQVPGIMNQFIKLNISD